MTYRLFSEPTPGYERVKATALRFVEAMKLGAAPWQYRKEPGGGESFYGSYHALHILDLFGGLDDLSEQDRDGWAAYLCADQCEDGLFRSASHQNRVGSGIESIEPDWHYTRGHLWALRILGRSSPRPLRFIEPLLDAEALYRWVKKYDWSNAWAASNQVLACATTLMAVRDWCDRPEIDTIMQQGMYPALEELLDENTGFWGTQFGADLSNGLFGTIHVTPIYFAQGWPLRAVERNIDSTLACQLDDGSFWPGGSDCPDFDGAYMMANLGALSDYRRDDLHEAARRYLRHALMHESADGCGWRIHRRDSPPGQCKSRPHWIWKPGASRVTAEYRDEDPDRTHIMLGSWFYPLSIALIASLLRDTGYEGPYRLNPMSLHECNVNSLEHA